MEVRKLSMSLCLQSTRSLYDYMEADLLRYVAIDWWSCVRTASTSVCRDQGYCRIQDNESRAQILIILQRLMVFLPEAVQSSKGLPCAEVVPKTSDRGQKG